MFQDEVRPSPCPSPIRIPHTDGETREDIQPKRKALCRRLDQEKVSASGRTPGGGDGFAAVRAGCLIAADAVPGRPWSRIEGDDEQAEVRIKRWVGECFALDPDGGYEVWRKGRQAEDQGFCATGSDGTDAQRLQVRVTRPGLSTSSNAKSRPKGATGGS